MTRWWLVAIVALGAVLRFFPIAFGLPYAQARPDETAALGLAVSVRSGDFNPHFFHWPSLAIYVFVIALILFFVNPFLPKGFPG